MRRLFTFTMEDAREILVAVARVLQFGLVVYVAILLVNRDEDPGQPREPAAVELAAPKRIQVAMESIDDARAIAAAGDTLVVLYAPGLLSCVNFVHAAGWTLLPNYAELDTVTWPVPDCGADQVDRYLVELLTIVPDTVLTYYLGEAARGNTAVRAWAVTKRNVAGAPSPWGAFPMGDEPDWFEILFDERACSE